MARMLSKKGEKNGRKPSGDLLPTSPESPYPISQFLQILLPPLMTISMAMSAYSDRDCVKHFTSTNSLSPPNCTSLIRKLRLKKEALTQCQTIGGRAKISNQALSPEPRLQRAPYASSLHQK